VSTYTPIATVTVTNSTTNAIDFTGIPQNYTDLVIVGSFFTGNSSLGVRVGNGSFDTGSNYSNTVLRADSSGAATNRGVNGSLADVGNGYADEGATIILNFQNYSNTTTNKIFLGRWTGKWTAGGTYVNATANLWRSTSAINQIRLLNYAGSTVYFTNGSTFNLYGIASGGPKAFGGDTVTTDGTYYYHTFRSSGTFTPAQNLTCDYLVVAGGGGSSELGGGGGAGGLRSTVTATGGGGALESALSLTANTAYTVTVGAGGAGGQNPNGGSGNNSVFATITSTGGGGGGRYDQNGLSGGSGGGAGRGASTTGGAASPSGQGYAGGNGLASYGTGGGGGAGAAGQNAVSGGQNNGGNGGNGVAVSISGSSVTYAGGGGGGGGSNSNPGTGGTGGGGSGGDPDGVAGANGTANTGGGAGGGAAGGGSGGAGGSGIVIIRYAV
jgi:hypothetical protein